MTLVYAWTFAKIGLSVRARRAFAGAVFAALVTFFFAPSARAGPSARLVYLRGAGAESCPDEQALRAAVAARLGYDPFFPWAPNTVFVEIARAAGAWRAEVKLVDDTNRLRGARDLRLAHGDCAAAVDAMALSISLAIDPSSLLGPAKERNEPAPAPPAAPDSAPAVVPAPSPDAVPPRDTPPPSAPSPSAQKPPPVLVDAGLGVASAFGAAPAPNVAGLAFVGVRVAWLSVTLEGRGDLESGAPADRGAYVRSSILAGSLVPCVHVSAFFGCAVVTLGDLRATSAVASPRENDAAYLAMGVRTGALVPLVGAWSLRVHLELLATATRPTLQVDGADVFSYGPASGGAGAAVVVRFR